MLTNIGGSDLSDFVKRTMSFLISASLARQYNNTGTRQKLFEVLNGNDF